MGMIKSNIAQSSPVELFNRIRSAMTNELLSGEKKEKELTNIYNELKKRDRLDIYNDALNSSIKLSVQYEGLKAADIRPLEELSRYELLDLLSDKHVIKKPENSNNGSIELSEEIKAEDFKGNVFTCKVYGDSMINAGIFEGDTLVVDKISESENEDIVVAEVKGKLFVKRLNIIHGEINLIPENENYKPFSAKEDYPINILGKVKYIIRKL